MIMLRLFISTNAINSVKITQEHSALFWPEGSSCRWSASAVNVETISYDGFPYLNITCYGEKQCINKF